ncbi:MAG: carbohydrate ABC transporter permease [Endomicrobiales bacterium]|nr:carbohydrate ABC transporter permease [Endomicrobiales bacterium]
MKKVIFVLLLILVIFLLLWPFAWQIITSLKTPGEISSFPVTLLPKRLYFENYAKVFNSGPPFHLYIVNSCIIAGGATLLCIVFGSLCGYALARLKVRGTNYILALFLGVAMFPQVAVLSPLFLILRKIGLLNTHLGLMLVYTAFGLPLSVWLLMNFFKELPNEIEESALIDGCSPLGVLYRIVLPLAGPGIFACAILVFIFCWNEFLFALVFNTSMNMRTVTVGITLFPGLYEIPWGTIFSAATLVTLPLILLILICQRRIISGLTEGGIK